MNTLPLRTETLENDSLCELAEAMISLSARLSSAKTGHERTLVERQIEATDRQIDRLVYDLYGLTDAEIALVEEVTGS